MAGKYAKKLQENMLIISEIVQV